MGWPWPTFWTNPAELERPHRCPLWPRGSSGAGVSGVLPIPALIASAEAFGRGSHASDVSNLEGLGLGRNRPDRGFACPHDLVGRFPVHRPHPRGECPPCTLFFV